MTEIKADMDFKSIKKLVEAITKEYKVRVGLLSGAGGAENIKDHDGKTNRDFDYAGLGALMEYGSDDGKIPARSFLQMPLEQKQKEIISKTKMDYSTQELNYFLEKGKIDLMGMAIILGANCVEAIQDAFDTQGFGQWTPNAPSTIKKKGSSSPLIDTGALRQKITAEIQTPQGTMYTGNKSSVGEYNEGQG